jgi:hypothetical protein
MMIILGILAVLLFSKAFAAHHGRRYGALHPRQASDSDVITVLLPPSATDITALPAGATVVTSNGASATVSCIFLSLQLCID